MSYDDIKCLQADGIGTISLDRGDGRNALRPQTLREICAALDGFVSDPGVRAIILSGSGKHFSAGADFDFLESLTTRSAMEIRDQIYSAFQGAARRIYHCPKPTVAAVNGAAITVACELALACDFRLVSSSGYFQESWIKLGLMPPLGGLFLLPRLIGSGRAMEMVLNARAVHAEEAKSIGLASEITPDEVSLRARALDFAKQLASLPPLAYRSAKEGLQRGFESTMELEWGAGVLAQSLLLGTNDFREGFAAVVERRAGHFNGT